MLGPGTHFVRDDIMPVSQQIESADVVDGRRFVNLKTIREFKRLLGRKKDLDDVILIDKYLKGQ